MSSGQACADAWLQPNLSLRANIEFVASPDPERYREVLAATALDIDIASMPDGDARCARGLSGGQKARLVRAADFGTDSELK